MNPRLIRFPRKLEQAIIKYARETARYKAPNVSEAIRRLVARGIENYHACPNCGSPTNNTNKK